MRRRRRRRRFYPREVLVKSYPTPWPAASHSARSPKSLGRFP